MGLGLQLAVLLLFGAGATSAAGGWSKYSSSKNWASTGGESPLAAAEALVARLLPPGTDASLFSVALVPGEDRWSLATSTDANGVTRVALRAMDGVGVGSALQHYLTRFAQRGSSWSGDNDAPLPSPLPTVPAGGVTRARTGGAWSYYQNVCTVSYSMAWWDWARWERELDWMATRGINLPLAFTGQEAVAQTVFRSLGVSDEEMGGFFAGPAFLAWYRMGNVRGVGLPFGAPLPQAWIDAQWALQLRIVARAKALGMTPVLPGFAGFVPAALAAAQPAHATAIGPSASWDDAFNGTFCCNDRVNVTDAAPFYLQIGAAFITAQRKALGALAEGLHMYNADQYNEMAPPFNRDDLDGLAAAAATQLASLRAADPQATWLMQGWLFLNSDVDFWGPAQVSAYLGAVPDDAMIVLGLASDLKPLWQFTESYYGKPFIWCMLHNFGGNVGLGGRAEQVLVEPLTAFANTSSTMVGIGITMEGINTNPLLYDLMLGNAWRGGGAAAPKAADEVAAFALARYGGEAATAAGGAALAAWSVLLRTVYAAPPAYDESYSGCPPSGPSSSVSSSPLLPPPPGKRSGSGGVGAPGWWNPHWWGVPKSLFEGRPSLYGTNCGFMPTALWYEEAQLWPALESLLAAAGASPALRSVPPFRADVVDVGRQVLSNAFIRAQGAVATAFLARNRTALTNSAAIALGILGDAERLLGSDKHFLLGTWIADARSWAGGDANLGALLEYNARNLVTLWGAGRAHGIDGGPGNIHDYASKQWAGLVASFYLPRWRLFLAALDAALAAGADPAAWDQQAFAQKQLLPFELTWQQQSGWGNGTAFATQPTGDTVAIANELFVKYCRHSKKSSVAVQSL